MGADGKRWSTRPTGSNIPIPDVNFWADDSKFNFLVHIHFYEELVEKLPKGIVSRTLLKLKEVSNILLHRHIPLMSNSNIAISLTSWNKLTTISKVNGMSYKAKKTNYRYFYAYLHRCLQNYPGSVTGIRIMWQKFWYAWWTFEERCFRLLNLEFINLEAQISNLLVINMQLSLNRIRRIAACYVPLKQPHEQVTLYWLRSF